MLPRRPAEHLPRLGPPAQEQDRRDARAAEPREEEVSATGRREDAPQGVEVRALVQPEADSFRDHALDLVEARYIVALLRRDAITLGLPDVLPRLSAHIGEERIRIAREVDHERPARLHRETARPAASATQLAFD